MKILNAYIVKDQIAPRCTSLFTQPISGVIAFITFLHSLSPLDVQTLLRSHFNISGAGSLLPTPPHCTVFAAEEDFTCFLHTERGRGVPGTSLDNSAAVSG